MRVHCISVFAIKIKPSHLIIWCFVYYLAGKPIHLPSRCWSLFSFINRVGKTRSILLIQWWNLYTLHLALRCWPQFSFDSVHVQESVNRDRFYYFSRERNIRTPHLALGFWPQSFIIPKSPGITGSILLTQKVSLYSLYLTLGCSPQFSFVQY